MKIYKKLNKRIKKTKSLLCIGLDPRLDQLPARFQDKRYPLWEFNRWIIDQTHQYALAYKPNTAFYEASGSEGWQQLEMTMNYLQEKHPDIVTICDAKRADIGSTNKAYVTAIFDKLGFDAITLHPYLGEEALGAFLERKDKAVIILCKTSNPGGGELQDLEIVGSKTKNQLTTTSDGSQTDEFIPLWQHVAQEISQKWNKNKNCMLVVGATYPQQLQEVRKIVGEMPILVPGVGAQGGDLEQVLENGLDKNKRGLIINSSRGIIFADDPAEAAKELFNEINLVCDRIT